MVEHYLMHANGNTANGPYPMEFIGFLVDNGYAELYRSLHVGNTVHYYKPKGSS